jgi:hypothetical protein
VIILKQEEKLVVIIYVHNLNVKRIVIVKLIQMVKFAILTYLNVHVMMEKMIVPILKQLVNSVIIIYVLKLNVHLMMIVLQIKMELNVILQPSVVNAQVY